jgi:hypothetical protein
MRREAEGISARLQEIEHKRNGTGDVITQDRLDGFCPSRAPRVLHQSMRRGDVKIPVGDCSRIKNSTRDTHAETGPHPRRTIGYAQSMTVAICGRRLNHLGPSPSQWPSHCDTSGLSPQDSSYHSEDVDSRGGKIPTLQITNTQAQGEYLRLMSQRLGWYVNLLDETSQRLGSHRQRKPSNHDTNPSPSSAPLHHGRF